MNEKIRALLTKRFALFKLAFVVHDVHFAYNEDRSRESFNKVNDDLYENCKTLAKAKYSWYNPLRYKCLLDARVIYRACYRFAWKAWAEG